MQGLKFFGWPMVSPEVDGFRLWIYLYTQCSLYELWMTDNSLNLQGHMAQDELENIQIQIVHEQDIYVKIILSGTGLTPKYY